MSRARASAISVDGLIEDGPKVWDANCVYCLKREAQGFYADVVDPVMSLSGLRAQHLG